MTFQFENIKLMFRDEVNRALKADVEMTGQQVFSGTVIQTFVPFSSRIGKLEVYSGGGQFTVTFEDVTVQVNNQVGWVPIVENYPTVSCEEHTISIVGSGTIGIGNRYYAGTCSLNVPIAFRTNCPDIAVPIFSFELASLEDLPKVVVEYSSRARTVAQYFDGHSLVEDIISLEIYSRYPSELDKMTSVLEDYFKEHYEYLPEIIHVGIVGIDPITLTRMEMFVRRIRLGILRRI
jgi:hypothetical protein